MSRRALRNAPRGLMPTTPAALTDAELLQITCSDRETRETITYWRDVVHRPRFVYFIQAWAEKGPVKIGQALDPPRRLLELQCGNPHDLAIRAVLLADNRTERVIHKHWWDHAHLRGEWFGGGMEEAIITVACEASRQQVQAHREGHQARYITEELILPKAHSAQENA